MIGRPRYTPYDGSAPLFTIGLTQLDPVDWIEPDDDLDRYLAEKQRLLARIPGEVFVAEEGTEDGQAELLALLADYLPEHHPGYYRRDGMTLRTGSHEVRLDDRETPPLLLAGSLVQDDLVIMRKKETDWHLAAGYVAFPSSWSLREKFGLSMDHIHAPVPGFQQGTRNAGLINRMFDNLPEGRIVRRFNWTLNPDSELHYPKSKAEGALPAGSSLKLEDIFARVERQTLRRLPGTADIVFTIRIYTDPLAMLRNLADGAAAASAFAAQLEALTAPQLAYKGLTANRNHLVRELRQLAQD